MAPQPLRKVDQRPIITYKEAFTSQFHPLLTPNQTPYKWVHTCLWKESIPENKTTKTHHQQEISNEIICGGVYGVPCIPNDISK